MVRLHLMVRCSPSSRLTHKEHHASRHSQGHGRRHRGENASQYHVPVFGDLKGSYGQGDGRTSTDHRSQRQRPPEPAQFLHQERDGHSDPDEEGAEDSPAMVPENFRLLDKGYCRRWFQRGGRLRPPEAASQHQGCGVPWGRHAPLDTEGSFPRSPGRWDRLRCPAAASPPPSGAVPSAVGLTLGVPGIRVGTGRRQRFNHFGSGERPAQRRAAIGAVSVGVGSVRQEDANRRRIAAARQCGKQRGHTSRIGSFHIGSVPHQELRQRRVTRGCFAESSSLSLEDSVPEDVAR